MVNNTSIYRDSADKGGFDEIRGTKPTKKPLQKVEETDFTLHDDLYKEQTQSKSALDKTLDHNQSQLVVGRDSISNNNQSVRNLRVSATQDPQPSQNAS